MKKYTTPQSDSYEVAIDNMLAYSVPTGWTGLFGSEPPTRPDNVSPSDWNGMKFFNTEDGNYYKYAGNDWKQYTP